MMSPHERSAVVVDGYPSQTCGVVGAVFPAAVDEVQRRGLGVHASEAGSLSVGVDGLRKCASRGCEVARMGGKEDGAVVAGADGDEFGVGVGGAAHGEFRVEGADLEGRMAETVERGEAGFGFGMGLVGLERFGIG